MAFFLLFPSASVSPFTPLCWWDHGYKTVGTQALPQALQSQTCLLPAEFAWGGLTPCCPRPPPPRCCGSPRLPSVKTENVSRHRRRPPAANPLSLRTAAFGNSQKFNCQRGNIKERRSPGGLVAAGSGPRTQGARSHPTSIPLSKEARNWGSASIFFLVSKTKLAKANIREDLFGFWPPANDPVPPQIPWR